MEPLYEDLCATNHTRRLVYHKKPGVNCSDDSAVLKPSFFALCGTKIPSNKDVHLVVV